MNEKPSPAASPRADAQRNRARILDAARLVFADAAAGPSATTLTAEYSLAEVARRAGVGRATLYRNFPGRQQLLEALFADEVAAVIAAAEPKAADPGAAFLDWLNRFASFENSKRPIVHELLEHTNSQNPVFGSSRQRVLAAGEPLLIAAQRADQIRSDITLEQTLDLVLAVVRLDRPPEDIKTILAFALDGLAVRR